MSKAIGILGGTFDPVHNAHLAIAAAALRELGLKQVLWLPTGAPPYRPAPIAASTHRLAMLKLAIAGEPHYAVDEHELQPGASGFTFDSVSSLRKSNPGNTYILLLGADQYAKREAWHRWKDLEKLCEIAVVARTGSKLDAKARKISMTPMSVSASNIRGRIAHGEDVSVMLPSPVLDYIRKKGLYR